MANDVTGGIGTLAIRAKNVRIVRPIGPQTPAPADVSTPDASRSGQPVQALEGKADLSVLLDDPSMMAPFYASLVTGDE